MLSNEPTQITATTSTLSRFFAQVYGWMTGGLLLTALVSAIVYVSVASSTNLGMFIVSNSWLLPVVFIVELLIVIGLSAIAQRLPMFLAAGLFLFYSALNGLFIGLLVMNYTLSSVFVAFAATAGTFLTMSIFGAMTKRDLSRWGSLAFMGLIGIIIGTLLNAFLIGSDTFGWILTYVGIAVFIVLIAYDTQKLKAYAAAAEQQGGFGKFAILGALSLYLDFINLFIRLLALFGSRD